MYDLVALAHFTYLAVALLRRSLRYLNVTAVPAVPSDLQVLWLCIVAPGTSQLMGGHSRQAGCLACNSLWRPLRKPWLRPGATVSVECIQDSSEIHIASRQQDFCTVV